MRRRTLAAALLAALTLPSPALADGLIVVDQGTGPLTPLAVRRHLVEVEVRGQVATTRVDQIFHNPGSSVLEGHYLFPIPPDAHLDRFSMEVDGVDTPAELLDAVQAREIYQDIVRRRRDPALLEYAGRDLFRVRIFPIGPGSDKRVRLSYTQVLRREEGLLRYRYPLNTEKFSSRPLEEVSVSVRLESAQGGWGLIHSPTHPVEVLRRPGSATVAWEDRHVRPDADFELLFAPAGEDRSGITVLTHAGDGGGDGYFLLLASPSLGEAVARPAPRDLVLVADTSGSMAAGGKLAQVRRALRSALDGLGPEDRFQLIRFATGIEPLFPGPVPATPRNLALAGEFLDSFRAAGGTAIEGALAAALAGHGPEDGHRPFQVVFLTDGLPTVGATEAGPILERVEKTARGQGVRIFPLGIGTDVNARLLDGLAAATRGSVRYVLPGEEVEGAVVSLLSRISHPVLGDLTLTSRGVRLLDPEPSSLPDLFFGEQLVVLGRYAGNGPGRLTLTGTAQGRRRSFDAPFPLPPRGGENDFIPHLWAVRRVGHLLEQIRLRGEDGELVGEVTLLARRHGIVTPYTAHLILEDEDRRRIPPAERIFASQSQDRRFRDDLRESFRGLARIIHQG